jgi:hypothetical protein
MPRRLDKISQGSPMDRNWRTINDAIAAIQTLTDRVENLKAAAAELRTRPRDQSAGGGGTCVRYKIKTVSTNKVVCNTYDGTTTGSTDIDVAFPTKLRGSAPSAGAEIRPAYAVNDEIFAIEAEGETGVSSVTWIDLNVDARRWMVSREVCTDGAAETLWLGV